MSNYLQMIHIISLHFSSLEIVEFIWHQHWSLLLCFLRPNSLFSFLFSSVWWGDKNRRLTFISAVSWVSNKYYIWNNALTFLVFINVKNFDLCLFWIWTWISLSASDSVANSDEWCALNTLSGIFPLVACVNKVLWGDKYTVCNNMTASCRIKVQNKKHLNLEKKQPRRTGKKETPQTIFIYYIQNYLLLLKTKLY